jgi:iron-sulfur cluster repair protein YtfE (RIC family)
VRHNLGLEADSILESDHSSLDALLDDATSALDLDAEQTYRALDLFWARLAVHIRAEHLVVFPALLQASENGHLADDDIPMILTDLRHDHDFFMKELARAIKALRLVFSFGNDQATIEIVRGLIVAVKLRLEAHNRIEEEMIYPMIAGLESSDGVIASRVLKELENLPNRFRSSDK